MPMGQFTICATRSIDWTESKQLDVEAMLLWSRRVTTCQL